MFEKLSGNLFPKKVYFRIGIWNDLSNFEKSKIWAERGLASICQTEFKGKILRRQNTWKEKFPTQKTWNAKDFEGKSF